MRGHLAKAGHNLGHNKAVNACKLLIPLSTFVDSQSSNPGSIPGSATKLRLATHAKCEGYSFPSVCNKQSFTRDPGRSGCLSLARLPHAMLSWNFGLSRAYATGQLHQELLPRERL